MARLSTPYWKIDFELITGSLIRELEEIEGFPKFECSTVHPDKIVFDFEDLGDVKRLDLEFNLREFGFTLTTFAGSEEAILVRNISVNEMGKVEAIAYQMLEVIGQSDVEQLKEAGAHIIDSGSVS